MRVFNFRVLLSFLFIANLLSPPASASEIPASFSFQGSGYGHGVGMSQVGARGQALEGDSATAILSYYYKDVVVAPVQDDQILRVNVGHLLTSVSMKTDTKRAHIELFDADVGDGVLSVADAVITAKSNLTFTLLGNAAIPSIVETSGKIRTLPSGKSWTIRWSGTRDLEGINSLLSLKIGKSTTKYKYGQIQVKLVKSALFGYRIEVTNSVRLHDEYLWGIGEMPSSWPLAALQAQVIASRTYALNKAGKIKSACDCDLYSATADQSFVGYSKEAEARYGAIWKSVVTSTSIDDSHGVAILYHDLPIAAYFFSSSGGQTESAIDAWGSYVPYAIGVADPWSLQINLNARYVSWIRPVSQEVVAGAFSLDDVMRLEISNRHQSGTVASITATSSKGKKSVLTGEAFRSKAKLPSTWFDFEIPQISEATPAPTDTATSNL